MTNAPGQPPRIYLAGPMFSAGDKAEQSDLADALEQAGYDCHVPQRDGIEVAAVMELLNDPSLHGDTMLEPLVLQRCVAWVTRAVVTLDVFQATGGCQCTVLNIDGRVPDEGAVVEATLTWGAGLPVVTYKTTSISELEGNNNPMIGVIGSWGVVPCDPPGVVAAVQAALNSSTAAAAARALPADVQQIVELGGVISDIRRKPPLATDQLAAAVKRLDGLPAAQMALLEPDALLQPMCRQVVLSIIEFSKLSSAREAERKKIFMEQIAALKTWIAESGVRDAILQNPISC